MGRQKAKPVRANSRQSDPANSFFHDSHGVRKTQLDASSSRNEAQEDRQAPSSLRRERSEELEPRSLLLKRSRSEDSEQEIRLQIVENAQRNPLLEDLWFKLPKINISRCYRQVKSLICARLLTVWKLNDSTLEFWLHRSLNNQTPDSSEVATAMRTVLLNSNFPELQNDDTSRAYRHLDRSDTKTVIRLVYKAVAPSVDSPDLEGPIPGLAATLRPYQRRAVRWMLGRENNPGHLFDDPSWVRMTVQTRERENESVYWNSILGKLSSSKPKLLDHVLGGILAEEMGLGKTVETLSTILCNPAPLAHLQQHDQENQSLSICTSIFQKQDRVACFCAGLGIAGADSFDGAWVECEVCLTWQHAACMGFSDKNLLHETRGYMCPNCCAAASPVPIKATIVVLPDPILNQWMGEIKRHVAEGSGLRVLRYQGVSAVTEILHFDSPCESTRGRQKLSSLIVRASQLAEYDIILTTYAILRKEFWHVEADDDMRRHRRSARKYRAVPSPLCSVKFWRIVLDEAQMAESATSTISKMVSSHLQSHLRWCITGTPIQWKGLEDLYGLFLFLQVPLLAEYTWWAKLMENPLERWKRNPERCPEPSLVAYLRSVIGRYMWRTAMDSVKGELALQKPEDIVNKLSFSPVEMHFYRRQYEDIQNDVYRSSQQLSGYRLSDHLLTTVMERLIRLRQACCHPQIGGNFGGLHLSLSSSMNRGQGPLTMDDILDQLVLRAKLECEEAQRQWVCAQCGLAAIAMILGRAAEADGIYNQVLQEATTNAQHGLFRLDILQKLHVLHNKRDALAKIPESDRTHTLRNHSIDTDIGSLKDEYLGKAVAASSAAWEKLVEGRRTFSERCGTATTYWWIEMFDMVKETSVESEILQRVNNDLESNRELLGDHWQLRPQLTMALQSTMGLKGLLLEFNERLRGTRQRVFERLERLHQAEDTSAVLERLMSCGCMGSHAAIGAETSRRSGHTRAEGSVNTSTVRRFDCDFCSTVKDIRQYEGALYMDQAKDKMASRRGFADENADEQRAMLSLDFRHDREEAIILKSLLNCIKQWPEVLLHLQLDADNHVEAIRLMQKESLICTEVWERLKERYLAEDEINMATLRIRQRLEGEEVDENQRSYIIHPAEVPAMRNSFVNEGRGYLATLRRKAGQLRYLMNLSHVRRNQSSNAMTDVASTTLCPVCQDEIGRNIVMLVCGHELCTECAISMAQRSRTSISCPQCRERTNREEISYFIRPQEGDQCSSSDSDDNTQRIEVEGSWGTKIQEITLNVKKIEAKGEKVLIFSHWNELLEIIGHALERNNVSYQSVSRKRGNLHGARFSKAVASFRSDASCTALLLSIMRGANGLNLTEANHIIFVEPLLNPSAEAQAIGRIHRIGQTKATSIHRFIVNNTIEEGIQELRGGVMSSTNKMEDDENTEGISEERIWDAETIRLLFGIEGSPNPNVVE